MTAPKSPPFQVQVRKVVQSRYDGSGRPASWDNRRSGVDTVQTSDGQTLRLLSDGGQSVPTEGWVLMITGGDGQQGYRWTLYGIPRPETSTSAHY